MRTQNTSGAAGEAKISAQATLAPLPAITERNRYALPLVVPHQPASLYQSEEVGD
jgi:hypothetical protein